MNAELIDQLERVLDRLRLARDLAVAIRDDVGIYGLTDFTVTSHVAEMADELADILLGDE